RNTHCSGAGGLRVNGHVPGPAEHVLEVVTPRTNAARLSSAEHLFGALVPRSERTPEPVSLEIVGDVNNHNRGHAVHFVLETTDVESSVSSMSRFLSWTSSMHCSTTRRRCATSSPRTSTTS